MRMKIVKYLSLITLISIGLGFGRVSAQQDFDLAQDAYSIFEKSCLSCHGPRGAYRDNLLIESAKALIASGAVVPGKPRESELYTRLLEGDPKKRMPSGQPQLPLTQIQTIENWIRADAPSWESQRDVSFITTDIMLTAIQQHLKTLDAFDRPSARYFTMMHLYNAGETPENLRDYTVALSKLVNSLSWASEITKPQLIDEQKTIFYIDLRDYEWDRDGLDVWTQLENIYPYAIEYSAETQAGLLLTNLREEMKCEVPFVHVDWFLATASLPPLYHNILDLPTTDRELERQLGIDVAWNRQNAPGRWVWRAGFEESGVSNHNRVVERHTFGHGAYWKSYDFAGSVERKNVLTHPLSFEHDGGEIIFNLPNGLQAYYISDAFGNRINAAPIDIVFNPGPSGPTVRTGIACIGCHTKGIRRFEDEVRAESEHKADPAFDKEQVLRLYVSQDKMDALVRKDRQRFKEALEATGNVFGDDSAEPVEHLYGVFHGPLDAAHAAAAVGLEAEALLAKIAENPSLQNLGLTSLLIDDRKVKRDAWTSSFEAVVACLYGENCSDFSPEKTGVFQQKSPKITGPWLWMIVSTGERGGAEAAASGIDFLAQMSNNAVTEAKIAADGAIAGDPVGNKVWTSGKISATESNNLNNMANATGLGSGDIDNHVAYGSIVLYSPREQKTTLLVGSDDAVKVWLNGKLVHNNPVNRGADDFRDNVPVTLKEGKNILLVAVYEKGGGWSGFFGFETGTEYAVAPTGFLLSTASTEVTVGEPFTVQLKAENISDLKGWQTDITFDPAVLKVNEVSEGDFLKQADGDTFFREGTIQRGKITSCFNVRTSGSVARGRGTLLSIQFRALANGWTYVTLRNFQAYSSTNKPIDSPPIEVFIVVGGQPASPTFVPEDTTLFHNYPNPFNPETWIPYQLKQSADVKIAIYTANGQLVRMLNLGHQAAGYYIGRHRAAHWDGRNTVGEPVASGIYFYQLQADNLSFLRKMVILK